MVAPGIALTALGFDFGLRSIGIAYGQSLTGSAQPLAPLKAKDGIPDWQHTRHIIEEWRPAVVVVGLPLNMDDSESELSRRARKFGNRLSGRFGHLLEFKLEFMDERLSSFAAKQDAKERGHKGNYKKEPIDSFAAQLILEDWFRASSR
ncbi:MAG: putative Holliday junction resolvase [Pseudohongiellaceae bacterium]|jgi:putative Holliday junction resolvase